MAFQALFQAERGGSALPEAWLELRGDLAAEDEDDAYPEEALASSDLDFAARLVGVLSEGKDGIDQQLVELIEGWTFGQMAQTDLNVLRLAMAELSLAETPPAVAVEMAVRLAKRFGGEDSGRFVNGVLAKALRRLEAVGGG